MKKSIKKWIFNLRLKSAIKQAKRDSKLFDKRMMVIEWCGKPEVFEKQKLKRLISMGFFKKGTTIQQLEKMAYYISK